MNKTQTFRAGLLFVLLMTGLSFATMSLMDAPQAEAQVKKVKKKKKKKGLTSSRAIAGVRGGLVVNGSGAIEVSGGGISGSTDVVDKSSFGVSGFALFPIGNKIRVGATVWYFPAVDLEITNSTSNDASTNLPSQVSLNVMGEYNYVIQKGIYAYGFGEAGWAFLLPADSDADTASGLNIAIGGGAMYNLNTNFGLRGEVRYEPYYSLAAENSVTNLTTTFTGQRLMINAGVAFGL